MEDDGLIYVSKKRLDNLLALLEAQREKTISQDKSGFGELHFLMREEPTVRELADIAFFPTRDGESLMLEKERAMGLIKKLLAFYKKVTDDEVKAINRVFADHRRREQERVAEERRNQPIERVVRTVPGYVYLIKSPTGTYKIGKSKDPNNRMRTFGVKLPFEVDYVCLISTSDMTVLEQQLHQRFAEKRVNGEWFMLDDMDVEYIKSLAGAS